jgi:GTP-binding protein
MEALGTSSAGIISWIRKKNRAKIGYSLPKWYNTTMLIDSVTITVKAGKGGNGSSHFHRDANTAKGGPDGGNGGNGGNVFIQGSTNLNDLRQFQFQKEIVADPGVDGKGKNLFGRNAEDLTIFVPLGTQVTDLTNGRVFEIVDAKRNLLVARGGIGGRGNYEFKSATNQAPTFSEKGEPGEEKKIHMELRIIADIGLVGLPNAGKSSLLSVLTNAKPVIGNYPFTTLEPNIGMMGTHPIADIPGLIEGASEGKGLGIKFLKHIEKTKILIHCIDASDENPVVSYETVREEFGKFSEKLLTKPEVVLITKTDLTDEEQIEKVKAVFKKMKKKILTSSIYDEASIEKLKKEMISLIKKTAKTSAV